jgi:hypothetical protein
MPSIQVALAAHGWLLHSSISEPQIVPEKPAAQEQRKPLIPSTHDPPLRQGWLAHSLMPEAQREPE